MDITREPFPTEQAERLHERLRKAVIRSRGQVSVMTTDLAALLRWVDLESERERQREIAALRRRCDEYRDAD